MIVKIIQPPYPFTDKEKLNTFQYILKALKECDKSVDLVLLPEYSNAPGVKTKTELQECVRNNTRILLDEVQATAERCNAFVAVNLLKEADGKLVNTTYLFSKNGEIVGEYYKQHLPVGEIAVGVNDEYTFQTYAPTVLECDDIRFSFLTCYDIYFNEYIERLAAMNVDMVLVSSYQRGERMDILEMQAKACAFRCNAYVLRSSYSMGANSQTGGCSMLVSPDGRVVKNMKQDVGVLTENIDPKRKYMRSNGYGQPEIKSNLFIEKGRTPWAYRPAGSMVRPGDDKTPYPRICAHRGFNTIAPENTMPAFASAIALGAEEIELDIWASTDGELVVCHDDSVDRTTDGHGKIANLTYEEIAKMDAGIKFSPHFKGLRVPTLEDVLRQFARQTIINIHVKSPKPQEEYDHKVFKKITDLIEKYDCRNHVYIAGERDVLTTAIKLAPDIPRCCLEGQLDYTLIDNAIKFKCQKVQLFKPYYTQEMIDEAHKHNITCNMFWSDDPAEAEKFIEMGIDTILTNDYLAIRRSLY
ncbi:MAG TPA: hypothetical protein GXX37_05835 [Clostridiaceae bacterium]|nr:hypothetical protein [Clostridiaceae bacterium]